MGCGASSAQKKAPFLAAYFKLLGKMMDATKGVDPMAILMNPAEAQKIQKQQDEFKPKLIAEIEKSFDNHDHNKDGVLSTQEAQEFFQHYVDLFIQFHEKYDLEMVKTQMAMAKKMGNAFAGMMDKDMKKELNNQMKEQAKVATEQVKKSLAAKRDDYKANKEQKDAEAFKVIDVSADGKVQRQELIEAFRFESEKNVKVHQALGLMNPNEAQAALAQQQAAAQGGQGADCNAQ